MKQFIAGAVAVLIAQKVLTSKSVDYLALHAAKGVKAGLTDSMTRGLERLIYGEKQAVPPKQTSYSTVSKLPKDEELKKVPRRAVEVRRHNGTEDSTRRFAHWVNSKDLGFRAAATAPRLDAEHFPYMWKVSFMKEEGDFYLIEPFVWVSYENEEFHMLDKKDISVMFEDA